MWKVTKLHLKNFIHLDAGLKKRDVTIDLSQCDKKINIFIGKMGSGKSSILGHLQPFSTYGSLDIRNQEDLILPEEEGLKEIEYTHDGHIYSIQHKYSWNKSSGSHSTKSYIQLDGKELNENGNVKSFKEVIKREFGIDQSFLRLLRLGPNVSNLINMKPTERKQFLASLLTDTEIYMMLYQKLNEDYRGMNSALSLISNKLSSLSADDEESLKNEFTKISNQISEKSTEIEKLRGDYFARKGSISTLLDGKTVKDAEEHLMSLTVSRDEYNAEIMSISQALQNIPQKDMHEISVEFGKCQAILSSLQEEKLKLETTFSDNTAEINRIIDFLAIQKNQTQLQNLQHEYDSVAEQYHRSKDALEGFTPSNTYNFLIEFINSILPSFEMNLNEMCSNNKEVIGRILNSDSSIVSVAKGKLPILKGTYENTRKLLQNVNFSAEYECPIPLFYPPNCPSANKGFCPFVETHPVVINKSAKDKRNEKIVSLQHKLDDLSIEISEWEDCISQYPLYQNLQKSWEGVSQVLSNCDALNCNSLKRLILDLNARTNWYDYDRLISYTEKCKQYDEFAQLESRFFRIRTELRDLTNGEIDQKEHQLEALQKEQEELQKKLAKNEEDTTIYKQKSSELEEILATITNLDSLKAKRDELQSKVNEINSQEKSIEDNLSKVKAMSDEMSSIEYSIQSLSVEYNVLCSSRDKLSAQLQDIATAKASYEGYLQDRNTLKIILSAVSSKEGIPLVMVKIFLEECKEIINELISDVFDDDLEILEFNISEDSNEFKIPYRINGMTVPDIELASQGQQAVISIALSFALCRKAMFDYNVMLLDEIDNSIHKTDRERFIMILLKQMNAVGSDQVFMITHNDIFQQSGLPVNIIMTTNENIDYFPNQSIMKLY